MNNNLKGVLCLNFKRNITAFLIISILGTLGHFVYEITGRKMGVGFFFPINESTWEHLKLLFYPALIYFGTEYLLNYKNNKNYISASVISIFIGIISIIVLFYTYQGVIGKNIDFINISIYYISVIITLVSQYILFKNHKCNCNPNLFLIPIFLTIILFAIFSFNPPSLGIFTVP